MNATPISDPKVMMPAIAATQNVRREAIRRSYSGLAARFWRTTNRTTATAATANSPIARVRRLGTGKKLRATTRAPIITADIAPPTLSTGSVDSLTCAGTLRFAINRARIASGTVIANTEPQLKISRSRPETRGPSIATPPPRADHSAIERVRDAPDQSAVISASVVG